MQDSLFDFPKMGINKPIRLITLFSGIGSQEMALRDIGADFEIAEKRINDYRGDIFNV